MGKKKRNIFKCFGLSRGVAWGILVAKVCILYPRCRVNNLIRKFYEVNGGWDEKSCTNK